MMNDIHFLAEDETTNPTYSITLKMTPVSQELFQQPGNFFSLLEDELKQPTTETKQLDDGRFYTKVYVSEEKFDQICTSFKKFFASTLSQN